MVRPLTTTVAFLSFPPRGSTWGEALFVLLQLLILVFLIIHYNGQHSLTVPIYVLWGLVAALLLGQLQQFDSRGTTASVY